MTEITQTIKSFCSNPEPKAFFGIILAILTYIFNLGNPEMWVIIGSLILIDLVTGILGAYKRKEIIESPKMFKTLVKIAVYGVVVALANLTARSCIVLNNNCPEGIGTALRLAAFGWVIATEGKSINENLASLGYKLPKAIEEIIQKGFK